MTDRLDGLTLGSSGARIKAAKSLLRRPERRQQSLFLAEGPQAVREALARPGTVIEVYASPAAAARHGDLVEIAAASSVRVFLGAERTLASLSDTSTPQGLIALCHTIDVSLADALESRPRLVALLANARDPGNVGTVLRSADAAGADLVVVTHASVDVYNAKCVRASAGSLFHLPVVVDLDLAAAVTALRAADLRVLAADGAGTTTLDEESDSGRLAKPTAWIFGNEAWGLPVSSADLADAIVRVPIHGQAESLNLAAAAAVCLYASARAQRESGG